jgi:hypothetical protein
MRNRPREPRARMPADAVRTNGCGRHMTDEQRVGCKDLADAYNRPQAQPNAGRSKNAATGHEPRCSRETNTGKNKNS